MEVLGHLKVIVPIGINLMVSGRTIENQTGSQIVLANEAANLHEVLSRSKDVLVCSF